MPEMTNLLGRPRRVILTGNRIYWVVCEDVSEREGLDGSIYWKSSL